jgi:hypothetical protein
MYRLMPVLKPQNDEGTAEVNPLLFKYNVCSLVSRPSCEGMDELRLLTSRSSRVSAWRLPMVVGTAEVNLLLYNNNACSMVSSPTCEGMDELRLFLYTSKYCRLVSSPTCEGMDELRLLVLRLKVVSAPRLPMVVGRLPSRPLLDTNKYTTLLAPPTVAHVTPVQAPGVVLQGS